MSWRGGNANQVRPGSTGAMVRSAGRLARATVSALLVLMMSWLLAVPAAALKPIIVTSEKDHIEITTLGDGYAGRGDSLMVETAAGGDGVTGRISVKAATPGTNPNWIVFALTNPTDKPIERWLTADRYTMAGSGVIWPDLDARREGHFEPRVILSTAHPAKFPDAIEKITGERPPLPERLSSLMTDEERFERVPGDLAAVQRFVEERARAVREAS